MYIFLEPELDLAGGVRPVASVERLVFEAERLGIQKCILPMKNEVKIRNEVKKIKLIGVKNIFEAVESAIKK